MSAVVQLPRLAREAQIIAAALEILELRHARGAALTDPDATRAYLRLRLAERPNEVFGVSVYLDNRHRVIACEELFTGTIDGTGVHPRVVAQRALALNAAAIIVFRNHPSGQAEPSRADEVLTRRLKDALALLDIRLLDHLVVSAEASMSMAERGP